MPGKQHPLTDGSGIHLFMNAGDDEGAALFYLCGVFFREELLMIVEVPIIFFWNLTVFFSFEIESK